MKFPEPGVVIGPPMLMFRLAGYSKLVINEITQLFTLQFGEERLYIFCIFFATGFSKDG